MTYYLQAEKVKLDDLRIRIEETDLVPSRSSLLENIKDKFEILKSHGIGTLADLRKELKNARNIPSFSKKTGIDSQYLILLRREIESYFPKAFPLNAFDWLDKKKLITLEKKGYKNTALLFEALSSSEKRKEIADTPGIDAQFISSIYSLADLTRIQWTSPLAARMLAAAGYGNAKKVSRANAEKLCDELERVNRENGYFKGKIGLRDVGRLIKSASYVS